jgi:regulator of sirC expression with transglutaminase-like and TPR domain|tara:strand:- start:32010 stop:32888 length:879 start_codon:yes stop_codon:yes gene_type:complete
MVSDNLLSALIRLVEDPDEIVYSHVRDKLLNYGKDAIPFLEISWEEEDWGLLFQSRIETIIHEIQFTEACRELKAWSHSDDKDILKGAIAVARYQYPGLDEAKLYSDIEKITQDVWLEINQKNTALEKVRILNKIFFGTHKFKGNSKNFLSPLNSYINTVLETRRGNPLSLCLLYSVVAIKMGMPIYGVNLPNHFILAYMDEFNVRHEMGNNNTHGVLFYINPFSKGSLFDENEIKDFLKSLNLEELREYFEPCSNTQIIKRMLTNLIAAFQEVGNATKVQELEILRNILDV